MDRPGFLDRMRRGNRYSGVRYLGLVSGLLLLAAFAAAAAVAIVQVQSAVAAYLAANAVWNRGQVETVHYLDTFAETGNPESLQRARRWHDIPLGDLRARRALEQSSSDIEMAREGFRRGQVHPDDIPRLIWMFRLFSDAPYFREAVAAWRESDRYILELAVIADRLEAEWQAESPSRERFIELRQELNRAGEDLALHAEEFRGSMSEASRALTTMLSFGSGGFFLALGGVATTLTLRLTRAIRGSERKFRATFQQAAVGIIQLDEQGCLLEVNQSFCNILGYSREEALQLRYPDLVDTSDNRSDHEDWLSGSTSSSFEERTVDQRLVRGDGTTMWARLTVSRFRDPGDSRPCFIVVVEDVSESHRLSAELSHQASHDDLTGLINRRAFERYLEEVLDRVRKQDSVHALCFIDLDQFKIVNDTSGHFVGDQLLRQVAEHLGHNLRRGDVLARLGGDEFGLILEDCEADAAVNIAEKLRAALTEMPFVWEDRSFNIGCTIGVVPITAESGDTMAILRAADVACHMAKEKGRNRIHLTSENDRELSDRREQMEWVGRIRSAINENRLYMDAQYMLSTNSPDCLRYEVLVRMNDENGETIPPGAFLPAAERFGIAYLVDRWVIEHVFRELSLHPEHLARLEACHINFSAQSFEQEDFPQFVLDLLDRYELPPEKICFEITETAAIRNLIDARKFMEQLGSHGCSFALDDFGTGLSSFAYLRQLPARYLKIDGGFVRDIASNDTDRAMVRAINDIGRTLGKTIIAESVEDGESLELLKEMGVHYAQGYHVHRPQRFAPFLADHGE